MPWPLTVSGGNQFDRESFPSHGSSNMFHHSPDQQPAHLAATRQCSGLSRPTHATHQQFHRLRCPQRSWEGKPLLPSP